ncbi:DUF502 domain-containing protein [Glaciecola siphonariae]|uniref:DUF502 domain-containing protein n=1 Tax=Glaciecola siphonariae TaxID=521012 RepID=A0ABV9LVA9_9ALTE
MFNRLVILILKGLIAVLPLGLTLYFLYWLATTVEAGLSPYFTSEYYFPGLGIVTTLVALALLGMLVNAYVVKLIIAYSNRFIEKLPLIKTLYGAIRDAVELFKSNNKDGERKPVSVLIAPDIHAIGFITNTSVAEKLFPQQGKVPVYMPLSYQIGGYTLYVPEDKITYLDIDVETAMRIAMTGGTSIQADVEEIK